MPKSKTTNNVSELEKVLQSGRLNIKDFVLKYKNLSNQEQERLTDLLEESLEKAKLSYNDLLKTLMEVKSYVRMQEDLLEAIEYDLSELDGIETKTYNMTIKPPILNSTQSNDKLPVGEVDEEDITKEDTISLKSKRERGRVPKLQELIDHFHLTHKAQTEEEELNRLNDMTNYNEWHNIGTDRTPHQVIINGTYIASIQFLEANSKNANYSVLTRVMLNPSGAYFNGESVLVRNRYLEDEEEAKIYMEKQMKKIQKQFFYEKAPKVIPNHGNKSSYYSFHLSKGNRENYIKAIEQMS